MTVPHGSSLGDTLLQLLFTLLTLLIDVMHFLRLCLRASTALAAENLFLRTRLALCQEREFTSQRAPRDPSRSDLADALLRLTPRAGHRPTGHV
jgi:hypothetical protein